MVAEVIGIEGAVSDPRLGNVTFALPKQAAQLDSTSAKELQSCF